MFTHKVVPSGERGATDSDDDIPITSLAKNSIKSEHEDDATSLLECFATSSSEKEDDQPETKSKTDETARIRTLQRSLTDQFNPLPDVKSEIFKPRFSNDNLSQRALTD